MASSVIILVIHCHFGALNPLRSRLKYVKLLHCWCSCHKAIFQLDCLPREGIEHAPAEGMPPGPQLREGTCQTLTLAR